MFYYDWLDTTCMSDSQKHYFTTKISSNLFYGLKKEFRIVSYVIPKTGLGLRDYKFFTYPMRAVYYTVGLYLLKLSQEFLNETYRPIKNITTFYGGNLTYKSDKIQLNSNNIYYRSFYEDFKRKIKGEINSHSQEKVILRLDVENYFNEISVSRLLNLLSHFIKPSIQASMKYDIFTKEQIACLFQFMSTSDTGIPQSENNIISSFIGHLYLAFGDMLVDDLLNSYENILLSHKLIRYADDIFISLRFREGVPEAKKSSFIHEISSQISELFYHSLGLKLNAKTKGYNMSDGMEKKEILKSIKEVSHGDDYFFDVAEDKTERNKSGRSEADFIQEKVDKIFEELLKIKKSKIDDYFIRDGSAQREVLQQIFDKSVDSFLNKKENKNKIKLIFEGFDFDLVKVKQLEILIILLKDDNAKAKLKEFYLSKPVTTIFDVDLIISFLCQIGFKDEDLIKKLGKNSYMSDIVSLLLDKKINCDIPGYYGLSCLQMKKLSEMPDVLEQTRLRILSERKFSYSVALNHLVNEIHAVCIDIDQENKKTYKVQDVVQCLKKNGVRHEAYIKVRNMFDRRNSNSVSHPGDKTDIIWEVTEQEYLDYYKYVGECLEHLLNAPF